MRSSIIIYLCFFLTGATALMYEVLWTRFFGLTFGNTTYSITTVLSAFMAGLAFGGLFFGRIADRVRQRLILYGIIEILIGLYAIIFPVLFDLSSDFYLHLVQGAEFSHIKELLLKFLLSFLIMFIPASLMGGSLPVLSRHFISTVENVPVRFGILYAINTVGAVAGVYLVGFHMIAEIGIQASLLSAATINIIIGTGIILYAKKMDSEEVSGPEAITVKEEVSIPAQEKKIMIFAAFAIMISGFAALSYEVVWTRILTLIIGNSTYAFSIILIAFLIGISLGSYLISYQRLFPYRIINFKLFSLIQFGIGLSAFALILIFSRLPYIMLNAFRIRPGSYDFISFYQFMLVLIIILIPTTLMGAALPVIAKIISRKANSIGSSIGNIYFFNTIGAVAGSFIAGFLFIPFFGMLTTLKIGVCISLLLGAGSMFMASIKQKLKVTVVMILIFTVIAPVVWKSAWENDVMDTGVAVYGPLMATLAKEHIDFNEGSKLIYYKEGVDTTFTIRKSENTLSLKINGKPNASTTPQGDMTTQSLLGYLPVMLHPSPENALVIGLGSGITSGKVVQFDSIRKLDIVEIEPAMTEAALFFRKENHDVLSDSKIRLFKNDVRNYLLETEETYDIIISQPSNLWVSGVASLYTTDFFSIVNEKLKPGGILCQWVHIYSMSREDLKMIMATMVYSFRDVQLWISHFGDILFIASNQKIKLDQKRFNHVMNFSSRTKEDFHEYVLADHPMEMYGRLLLDKFGMRSFARGARFNSDNRPFLEFAVPKYLYVNETINIYSELTGWSEQNTPTPFHDIRNEKNIALTYYHRSKIYTQIKWTQKGLEYIQKALDLDETNADYYYQLGNILLNANIIKEAEEAIMRGLELDTTSSGILMLADMFNAEKNYDESLRVLREHRNIVNDYEMNYAMTLYRKKAFIKAIPYFKEALNKKQGQEYILLEKLGNCYRATGQPDPAKMCYIKSIEKEEMNLRSQGNLADLYFEQGMYDMASKIYLFIAEHWQSNPKCHKRLSECFTALGRSKKAQYYQEVFERLHR